MGESRRFKIVDQRTGDCVTSVTYFTRTSAEQDITAWQNRHDRGGRPDISHELLNNMRVIEGSAT